MLLAVACYHTSTDVRQEIEVVGGMLEYQSMFAVVPMLHHILQSNRDILFIQMGIMGRIVVHYVIQERAAARQSINGSSSSIV